MRVVSLAPAVLVLLLSAAASAQTWEEYVNRGDFFTVNFPGEPARQDFTYKTAKGTSLPAHIYTAEDKRGRYTLTVVDYNSAKDELATAIDEAAKTIRAKGVQKYEGVNMLDMHRSWRMSVQTPAQRVILAEILVAMNGRLYLSEADTPVNAPPAAQFQASLQVLNDEGVRIRYREVQPATAGEIVPVTAASRERDTAEMLKQVAGTWRSPSGTCQAAFFKAEARVKTKRGEEAMTGTLVNSGATITGQAIIQGPRVGQFINPATDKAIFLFEPLEGDKLGFSFIGEPATGWPDATVQLCPGSRG